MSLINKSIQYYSENADRFPRFGNLDRSVSLSKYGDLGLPNTKMEKWQKSDINKVLKKDFNFNGARNNDTIEIPSIVEFKDFPSVNFLNGEFQGNDGLVRSEEGVVFGSLVTALDEYPELIDQHLNSYIKEDLNGLNALNSAIFENGFFLYVPKNLTASIPAHWLNHAAGEQNVFAQMRNLIVVEKGASFTLLQSDNGSGSGSLFINSVTEVHVGANARFEWYREQDLRTNDALVNSVFCHMDRDAYFKLINTTLHGSMVRNDVHVKMNGENCDANIMGLYLPVSGEQVDNQVFVEHAKPHCVSNELFKGVLDGKGSSIFNGHILVAEDAQKTNAYQTNRSVLLSDEANAFAKPFLEIYADDVRCSHGATVGQLDENALFYLRSRGLSEEKARSFLVKAFVGEVIDECEQQEFHDRLVARVNAKLEEKE